MLKSKIALSLALVVAGTASAAMAAPKHVVRHQMATVRQAPGAAYLSFGSLPKRGRVAQPMNQTLQDIGFNESLGN